MASASFRDSMNSLGWSRRDADVPVRTSSTTPILSKLSNTVNAYNPFAAGGSVRLPTDENPGAPLPARTRREEEEAWFALSRWDRLLVFGGLNLAALALFIICFTLAPFIVATPRKFAILSIVRRPLEVEVRDFLQRLTVFNQWSVASVLFLASWAVLMGPVVYFRHLVSGPRLPFTAAYFSSIALTLYFSLKLRSFPLTLISSIAQLACLLWYLVSYFPMGSSGLWFATRFGGNRIAAWMNG